MAEVHFTKAVKDFFREAGARGGKARAKRHSKAELSKWGKMGGRPRKAANSKAKTNRGGAR